MLTPVIPSEGTARVTLYAADGNAQTFDYQAGDIAYIPTAWGERSVRTLYCSGY